MKKTLWALIIICSFGLSLSTAAHAQIPSCSVSVSVNTPTVYLGQAITGTASVNENNDGKEVDTAVTVTSSQGDETAGTGHVNFSFTATTPGLVTITASANVTPNPTASVKVMVVGIDKLQYNIGGQGAFADVPSPLVVPVGSTVDFQAVIAPAGASWPGGKPVWGGTSGASGTGATTAVTFNTVSTSSTDYKTVTAECGNTVTANVIVYSMEMDRDGTQITTTQSVNVGEMMNLSAVIKPDGLAAT